MPTTIKYIGVADNYAELSVTGKQSVWQIGQQEERPDAEAASLLATGMFSTPSTPVTATTNPLTGGITLSAANATLEYRGLNKYTGIVANKCRSCFSMTGTQYFWQGMHTLTAMDNISPLSQLVYGAWYTGGSGEVATTSSLIINSLVLEYPIGTLTRIKFSGSNSVSIPSGTNATSDAIGISIPAGARFRIRQYSQCASGMIYVGGSNIQYCDEANGDTFDYSASAMTDNTMGTMVLGGGSTGQGFCFPPLAIIGPTSRPSFALIGDSRVTGLMDRYGDSQFQRGVLERGIGANFGLTVLSQASETAATFNSAGTRRAALVNAYASHVIVNYGINDMSAGAATVLSRLATLWSTFPTKKVYQSTISPNTTSSDSWATVANQTAFASEAARLTLNASIRYCPAPLAGVFDTADIVESSRRSGKWNTAYTTDASLAIAPGNQTWDGLHENSLMCAAIAAHSMWSPSRFALGTFSSI